MKLLKRFAEASFFWKLVGENPDIIEKSPYRERLRFSFIGLTVAVVALTTGVSITYGVYELLESYYFGLPVGLFAGLFVLTLYIFIIYTLTRNVLPTYDGSRSGRWLSLSLRIIFLASLGFITSQPVEYYLFSNNIDGKLSEQIARTIEEKNKQMNIEFTRYINDAEQSATTKEALIKEVGEYRSQKKNDLVAFANFQYNQNFFIRRMILMDTELWYIWPFSLAFIVLFLIPIVLKRIVPSDGNYYKSKAAIENNIVLKHHQLFVDSYNELLASRYKVASLKWKTIYLDPPYNTTLLPEYIHHSEQEFENWLLSESVS